MAESAAAAQGRIFISYRREDSAYPAGWLFDRLADSYGKGQIFKDVDNIELGEDFVERITAAVGSCDVLLALIGPQWLTIADERGRRRLDSGDDFVRLEIEAALTRKVLVIPILVDGASMPDPDELPPSLAKLVRRQALELSPNRFETDTGRLLKVLDKTLAEAARYPRGSAVPVADQPPITAPPITAPPPAPAPRKVGGGAKRATRGPAGTRPAGGPAWWQRPVVWGVLVIVAGLVAIIAVVAGSGGSRGPPNTSPSVTKPHPSQFVKLRLVGDAVTQGDRVRLTSAAIDQNGAAWSTDRKNVQQPFTATFHFQITDPRIGGGADGIAFVIQNHSGSSLGIRGGGIGYDGIPNSLAVEFDTSQTPV
jgi:hypothetical protein